MLPDFFFLIVKKPPADAATAIRTIIGAGLPVLQKYADVPKVIVIGHGMMIEAVTGVPHPNCGEIVPFSLVGKE